jgi:prolipoprotein diacylglyceryltransferase
MEFTLLAAAMLGVGGAYVMLWWEARHGNADRCAGNLWDTMLMSGMAGLVVGRIVAMLLDGVNPIAHPADIILVRSGVATVGATLGAAATFLWLARREPIWTADAISAAALAGLAGWHAGSMFRGSFLGTPSDLPWAMTQSGSSVTRHPVEIYAAIAYLVVAVAVALWKAYGRPPLGAAASVAIIGAAGVRLLTEPMRPSLSGGPVWFYALGVMVGIGGLGWSLWNKHQTLAKPTGDQAP